MKLQLPLDKTHPLVGWANSIRGLYGQPVFLVGSQITGKENPRDIDVVCAIPDDEFTIRFGDVNEWCQEGVTGLWTEIRWKWSDECIKRWKEGSLECGQGYNIDFKIQLFCQFKGFGHIHKLFPPVKLDTRET